MATDEEYLDNLLKAVTQETESRAEEKNDHIEEPEVPVAEPEQKCTGVRALSPTHSLA